MKGILIQQRVFKAIDDNYLENISEEKIQENDEFAYSSIILNLSDTVLLKVGKQNSSKELWDKLEELYTETSLPSKLFLLEKVFRYKLNLSKNIDENLDDFTKLIQDIKLTGDKNIDEYSPIVLLNAIPESYSDVKAVIKYGRDSVNIETVVNGLKSHYIKDCRKPRKGNRDRYEEKEKANNVSNDNNGEVFVVCEANSVNSFDKHEWLIVFGCTFHMSLFKEIFSNFRYEHAGFVSMANEKRCEIEGLGDISLCFKDGYRMTLKNVRYVPDLSHNLISCAALEEDGLEGRWGKGLMKIMKGSLIVIKAERKRNLYICNVSYDNLVASVSGCDLIVLWHKRLGHISQKGLDFLRKDGILNENIEKLDFCDDWVLGKHHKVHFPASPSQIPPCLLAFLIMCMLTFEDLLISGLSKSFWGEAVLTAAHLINMSPSVPLLGKTPEHVWTEKTQSLEKVKAFNKVENNLGDNQQEGELENTLENEPENKTENAENLENPEPNPLENYQLARDRNRRQIRTPVTLRDFETALNTEMTEPTSIEEAMKSKQWLSAMNEEMKSLKKTKPGF
ncbi:UNVERIFIED_CONTAM: Retrovirus-related Pol polyprotein from transposon TNT 1-94 [Sesamum indicum]